MTIKVGGDSQPHTCPVRLTSVSTSTSTRIDVLLALMLWSSMVSAVSHSKPLVPFGTSYDLKSVKADDATATLSGSALRVATGSTKQWPGITILPPGGKWDVSAFGRIEAEIKNLGTQAVTVSCRVDNPGANGIEHCVTDGVTVAPGQSQTLRVALQRASSSKLDGRLAGMRGYPVAPGGRGTIDPSNVTQILFFVTKTGAARQFEVSAIRAAGEYTPPTAWTSDADPFFPFIDELGQYKHKSWPGKTASAADLVAQREAEAKDLAARAGPADWDKFGGWAAGPQREATGFFRTERINGKWWLITPEGRLFFSSGIDCVGARHHTAIDDRAGWFETLPAEPEFKRFHGTGYVLKGDYAGRTVKTYSFNSANLRRKYGPEWEAVYPAVVHQRLRSWGLNTIGMWSSDTMRSVRRTPYVDALSSHRARQISGSEGYWSKFPDPFDPALAADLRRQMAAKKSSSAGDAWCLGYFSDNEMSWGDDLSLAIASLRSPADQPAKQAFVADLRAKYATIQKLNDAWGTGHESWDSLIQGTNAPDRKKAEVDLAAFYTRVAEQYFRTVRDAIKDGAPHQLYLGCRFAWVNARAASAAAKYCDVVSYNLYRRSVADFQFNGGADVPLIIGEFHFGALDRGMFHTGLVPVATQQARAESYRAYVEGALRHPQFVGCHWFEYQDEPTTGRVLDEENYQIGFVDVADSPYPETIRAARAVGEKLYQTRFTQ